MEDERTAEEKLRDADNLAEQAFRIVAILTRRAGGKVVVTEAEMIAESSTMETSLDVPSGAITIRITK